MNPADIFNDGNWMFSQSRTMSSRRSDLLVLVTLKLKHRKSSSSPMMQEGDVSTRVEKEFAIAFRKIYDIVMRNSKLIVLKRNASRWTSWRTKISPIVHHPRNLRDVRKLGLSLWTHLAEMHRWNSDQTSEKHLQICTVSTALTSEGTTSWPSIWED